MTTVEELEAQVYGTEYDEGDMDILWKRLTKLLELLLEKGVLSRDEYLKLIE